MNKNTSKINKKHVCQECGTSFNRPYRLALHLLVHKNIKSFVCGEKNCGKAYTNKSHLDRHIQSVHIQTDFDVINSCPHCMKVFSNRQNLKRHIKSKHVDKVAFTCDVCKTDFRKKHLLSAHMYQHTFIKPFSCDLCSKEFITLADRKKHMKYHKTYNCDRCETAFHHWSKYQRHRKTEHYSKEYICNECNRKFKERHHIVHHMKIHMSPVAPKVFLCWFEDCGRSYSRHSNLKQHIRVKHLDITHPCNICEAKLTTKAKLKAHLLNHLKPETVKKQPKTISVGRRERKDKGTSKTSTAMKLAGLIFNPENEENGFNQNIPGICANIEKTVEVNGSEAVCKTLFFALEDGVQSEVLDQIAPTNEEDLQDSLLLSQDNVGPIYHEMESVM